MFYLNSNKPVEIGDAVCEASEYIEDIRCKRLYVDQIDDKGRVQLKNADYTRYYSASGLILLDYDLPIAVNDIVLHYTSFSSRVGEVLRLYDKYQYCKLRLLEEKDITDVHITDVAYLSSPDRNYQENPEIKTGARVKLPSSDKVYVVHRLYRWANKAVLFDFTEDAYIVTSVSELTYSGHLLEVCDRVTLKSDTSPLRKLYQVHTVFNDGHTLIIIDHRDNFYVTDIDAVEKLKDRESYL